MIKDLKKVPFIENFYHIFVEFSSPWSQVFHTFFILKIIYLYQIILNDHLLQVVITLSDFYEIKLLLEHFLATVKAYFQSLLLITLYLINVIRTLFLVKSEFEYLFHQNTYMKYGNIKRTNAKIFRKLAEFSSGLEHLKNSQQTTIS